MILTREVRMVLGPPPAGTVLNSWSGWPASDRLLPTVAVRLGVQGPVSPTHGMICDIQVLDRCVRRLVPGLPAHNQPGASYLQQLWEVLQADETVPSVSSLELAMTPTLRFQMNQQSPQQVTLVQQFEFSAAHRLHADQLSDEENRAVFGKCNLAHGHGHNYVLEVAVTDAPSSTGEVFPLEQMQTIVRQQVIERFDHRHLNLDCEEFRETNPTVEHIAQACWQLLDGHFAPARLTHLRLYETPKTWVDLYGNESP